MAASRSPCRWYVSDTEQCGQRNACPHALHSTNVAKPRRLRNRIVCSPAASVSLDRRAQRRRRASPRRRACTCAGRRSRPSGIGRAVGRSVSTSRRYVTALGVRVALEARRRRAEHAHGAGALRAHERHVARVVAHALVLLERAVVLLVDDDHAEVRRAARTPPSARRPRSAPRRAAAATTRRAAPARVSPQCRTATWSPKRARNRAASCGVSAISGTSTSAVLPDGARLGDHAQVDLGLAAAGDAVQQERRELRRLDAGRRRLEAEPQTSVIAPDRRGLLGHELGRRARRSCRRRPPPPRAPPRARRRRRSAFASSRIDGSPHRARQRRDRDLATELAPRSAEASCACARAATSASSTASRFGARASAARAAARSVPACDRHHTLALESRRAPRRAARAARRARARAAPRRASRAASASRPRQRPARELAEHRALLRAQRGALAGQRRAPRLGQRDHLARRHAAARRQRGLQRLARRRLVVVRDPQAQLDQVGRQRRLVVEDLADSRELHALGRPRSCRARPRR